MLAPAPPLPTGTCNDSGNSGPRLPGLQLCPSKGQSLPFLAPVPPVAIPLSELLCTRPGTQGCRARSKGLRGREAHARSQAMGRLSGKDPAGARVQPAVPHSPPGPAALLALSRRLASGRPDL